MKSIYFSDPLICCFFFTIFVMPVFQHVWGEIAPNMRGCMPHAKLLWYSFDLSSGLTLWHHCIYLMLWNGYLSILLMEFHQTFTKWKLCKLFLIQFCWICLNKRFFNSILLIVYMVAVSHHLFDEIVSSMVFKLAIVQNED